MRNKTNSFGLNVNKSNAKVRVMNEKTVGFARSYFNGVKGTDSSNYRKKN